MAKGKCAEHLPGRPKLVMGLVHHDLTDISGFTFPAEVYLCRELVMKAGRWAGTRRTRGA
jgi:hypothetical protein